MIIDISNEIFTNLKNTITTASVGLSYDDENDTFPCITFEENTNTTNEDSVDTSGETANDLAFEINIFTNGTDSRSTSKALRSQIDGIMSGQYRMSRDFASPTPNYLDENIYKYTMRYSCVVDKNKKISRR